MKLQAPHTLLLRKLGLPGDWMENKQTLANGCHFFLCYTIVFTNWVFARGTVHITPWLLGLEAFLVVFVLVKEFWYDLHYETGETMWTSTQDALGWLFGNIFAWLMIGLRLWVHG